MSTAVEDFYEGRARPGNPGVHQAEEWFVLKLNGVPLARRCKQHVEITTARLPFQGEVRDLLRAVIEHVDMRLERTHGVYGEDSGWTIKQGPHKQEEYEDIDFDPESAEWTLLVRGSVYEQLSALEDAPEDLPEADVTELDIF